MKTLMFHESFLLSFYTCFIYLFSDCGPGFDTSANPLFRDSTYSNYRNSTVFDSAYSIRCHRVSVPLEHSAGTVHLQYVT